MTSFSASEMMIVAAAREAYRWAQGNVLDLCDGLPAEVPVDVD